MNYWFKRKRYGWGWTPSTWQGWLVCAVHLLIVVGAAVLLNPAVVGGLPFFAIVGLSTAGLIGVCYWKGEPPKWTWGDDDK
jgi:hypothetical protein